MFVLMTVTMRVLVGEAKMLRVRVRVSKRRRERERERDETRGQGKGIFVFRSPVGIEPTTSRLFSRCSAN